MSNQEHSPVGPVAVASTALTDKPTVMNNNWDAIRQRLVGNDFPDALKAAKELRETIVSLQTRQQTSSTEFPLLLSALLPAISSVLGHRTRPTPDATATEHILRHTLLELIAKLPINDKLRPHAPHLVAMAMDVLHRDFEENALTASKLLFDLFKVYRNLPHDYVQPYLDFVIRSYRSLPMAIQQNFRNSSSSAESSKTPKPVEGVAAQLAPTSFMGANTGSTAAATARQTTPAAGAPAVPVTKTPAALGSAPSLAATIPPTKPSAMGSQESVASPSSSSSRSKLSLPSHLSFRVLTECPLMVMLMFQLYPKYVHGNIPVLIAVMMEALELRGPTTDNGSKYTGELVAAQAKTLSFLTYLLRSFSKELASYQDRLAHNVVALLQLSAPASRKELLVATRHLLTSETFRHGFVRHVDVLLEERVLLGRSSSGGNVALRPLAFTTLSDLVQHVRSRLTLKQLKKVVGIFSRVLHDATVPSSTQYIAVRTLLSVVDRTSSAAASGGDPQVGRDLLVWTLQSMVEKLECLVEEHRQQQAGIAVDASIPFSADGSIRPPLSDSIRDVQSMVRAIVVGHKTVIYYLHHYRNQQRSAAAEKDSSSGSQRHAIPSGSNEEVSSAWLKLTHTEVALIDKYIRAALQAIPLLKLTDGLTDDTNMSNSSKVNNLLAEQHRDALTYFASAFTTLDGYTLRRTLGQRLGCLVGAIIDDPTVMVVPRHLLAANATTSYEFCCMLLDYLIKNHLDDLEQPNRPMDLCFVSADQETTMSTVSNKDKIRARVKEREEQAKLVGRNSPDRKTTTVLQLLERILKSLSVFPDNEKLVRRHLRRIVATCLKSAMECPDSWPDSYIMLLRYVFRSISAGKFEESYRELLPLIPSVLNGLHRIVYSVAPPRNADQTCSAPVLLHCAIELCLTIPARLSSLLPHLNLLLRIIVPALDSKSGDLVNLG